MLSCLDGVPLLCLRNVFTNIWLITVTVRVTTYYGRESIEFFLFLLARMVYHLASEHICRVADHG